ncbi:nitrilase [Cryptococcus neoformans 125.91]|nr:nitrilase [Cryptococcus neoformans var. grubii 125.91]
MCNRQLNLALSGQRSGGSWRCDNKKRQYATLMICWIFSTFLGLCFGFQMIVYKDHQNNDISIAPQTAGIAAVQAKSVWLDLDGLTLMAVSIKSALSSRKLEKRA